MSGTERGETVKQSIYRSEEKQQKKGKKIEDHLFTTDKDPSTSLRLCTKTIGASEIVAGVLGQCLLQFSPSQQAQLQKIAFHLHRFLIQNLASHLDWMTYLLTDLCVPPTPNPPQILS